MLVRVQFISMLLEEPYRKNRAVKISENVLNILAAKTYRGIGKAWIIKHFRGNEPTEAIVGMLNRDIKQEHSLSVNEFEDKKQSIRNQLERFSGVIDGIIAIGDPGFPSCRGLVKNSEKPVVLFYKGDLRLLDTKNKNITVIGLLDPDESTEEIEKRFVSILVSNRATIVSGLALGCDSVAHKQTLLSGGKTVAILPSPISDILPKANKELAEEIVKNNGLLISEYYEKANSKMELSSRYQERDRLQALFSDCVVLTASYAKNDFGHDSGSRHAMEYALVYSIPRAVMYDPKLNRDNPKYDLNRQLIREDGKIIVIGGDNVQESIKKILFSFSESPGQLLAQKDLFG